LFCEYVAPKADARQITTDDVKRFLAWRKSKGFDPGTTLYTDRVILHNFFSKLKLDNPVKGVPRLPRFRKKLVAYTDSELKKFFASCDAWEKAFFALALSSGLRRGELKTLHWSDLDLARKRVYVTAKGEYHFTPKDWEERSVPLTREVAQVMHSVKLVDKSEEEPRSPDTNRCPPPSQPIANTLQRTVDLILGDCG
jgi:integrase